MTKKIYKNDLERIDAAWEKLAPMLNDPEKTPVRKLKPWLNKKIIAAAAMLILMSTIGLWFLKEQPAEVQYFTKYGQTLRVQLPDSSVVMLNGNSQLSYRKNWPKDGDREVKVDGEAYFSIKHTQSNQRFFVRMPDRLSVEVLGTEFNINTRNHDTRVVLNSGKIDFHMEALSGQEERVVQMKPGDLVEYQSTKKSYTRKIVDPTIYSSWKTDRLVFDKTPLREVLNTLHNTYGLEIEVEDPKMLAMNLSGSAPTTNIDILIQALSATFNINFIKKGDTLIVTNAP
ncbi:FecR family protein [Pedobacter gandavensis]|uniref:FecR family protein n=1 Tax=Pedobacter gandavensis TaxID=2679963 RepID=UPI00292CD280|nr:FecR domain-containing protein [Pedobacter gandavensis]